MAQDTTDTKIVAAQCLCKAAHFTLTLKKSDLPLSTHMCHCSICRWTHGAMSVFHAELPAGVVPEFVAPSNLGKLTGYNIPGTTNIHYFCSTCGCHMAATCWKDGSWAVSTSVFVENEPIYQIKTHVFTKSALGGGYNEFLPRIGDRDMRIWNPTDGSEAPKQSMAEHGGDGEERLRAECHCGGVSFTIARPNEEDMGNSEISRLVSHIDKRKWIATIDACDSCRLTSGTHVVSWTFVPLSRCEPEIGQDLLIGTMKTFESSPGARRSFCGVCGATVFYAHEDRKEIVDLAVGILRAPEGARAENWLTWRARRIGWADDGLKYNQEFIESLAKGFKDWSVEKYGNDGVPE